MDVKRPFKAWVDYLDPTVDARSAHSKSICHSCPNLALSTCPPESIFTIEQYYVYTCIACLSLSFVRSAPPSDTFPFFHSSFLCRSFTAPKRCYLLSSPAIGAGKFNLVSSTCDIVRLRCERRSVSDFELETLGWLGRHEAKLGESLDSMKILLEAIGSFRDSQAKDMIQQGYRF